MEAGGRIELPNTGFAVPCITTLLPSRRKAANIPFDLPYINWQLAEVQRALAIGFFIFAFAVYGASAGKLLSDPDTAWHMAAGELIIREGSVPEHDPWSFSAGTYKWFNISWLWDVLAAFIHRLDSARDNFYYPALFAALLNATAVSLVAFRAARKSGIIATVIVTALGVVILSSTLPARPQSATFALLSLFMLILETGRGAFAMPPLMVLWANCHGGFLAGFSALGAFFIQKPSLKSAAVIAACLAATLFNPYGAELLEGAARSASDVVNANVEEWKRFALEKQNIIPALYFLLFLFLLPVVARAEKWGVTFLALFWMAASLLHMRNLPIFVIISAPMLASALHKTLAFSARVYGKEAEYRADFDKIGAKPFALALAVLLAFFASGAIKGFYDLKYPRKALEYLKQEKCSYRLFNYYNTGGYIVYSYGDGIRHFIDGRAATAFPPEVIEDYFKFHNLEPGWKDIPGRYHADALILPQNSRQAEYFGKKPEWKTALLDREFTLLVKKISPCQ